MGNIFTAAFNGDLELIKVKQVHDKFGEQTAKEIFGAKDSMGRTILHTAASEGRTPMCKYLVETIKVDINSKDLKDHSPLHFAVLEGHYWTSCFLLGHGALPNMTTNNGLTPLHYAAKKGRKYLLKLLITMGAEIDVLSASRGTPLRYAAAYGQKDAVKILLGCKANPNYSGHPSLNPLIGAIQEKSIDCVRLLLKNGADPNLGLFGEKPLTVAVCEGHLEIIKCLLKQGAEPNATNFYDFTPLEIAAAQAATHSSKKFLEAKENGAQAIGTNDYMTAVHWYKEALRMNPTDETSFSNRSLCWSHLNEAETALSDADCCVKLKPKWAKGYYLSGVAWKLLKDYQSAVEAFGNACKYDPRNQEFQDAHSEALAVLRAPRTDNFRRLFAD